MVDLVLVVSAGAFGLIATVYSVIIFFESERSKRREAWLLIGGASLVSVVLSGVSAYRASKSQQAMATTQSAMANDISEVLQVLRARAPKHYIVSLAEDVKTGKSSGLAKEISDAEYKRRQTMLRILRLDYFLEKGTFNPRVVAGTEWPPIEWINQRLAKLGETWTVLPGKNASDFTFVEPYP